jgi:hypothetical protein
MRSLALRIAMDTGFDAAHPNHDRYAQGWKKPKQIDGEAGKRVVADCPPGPGLT